MLSGSYYKSPFTYTSSAPLTGIATTPTSRLYDAPPTSLTSRLYDLPLTNAPPTSSLYDAPPTSKLYDTPPIVTSVPPTQENEISFAKFLKDHNNLKNWTPEETTPKLQETTPTLLPSLSELPVATNDIELPAATELPVHVAAIEDDSNSEWSSSGESSDEEQDQLRPSVHMNIRSKFEWLSIQQQPNADIAVPPPVKKLPPPIAPKPKLFKRTSNNELVKSEAPISFDEVIN